MTEIRLVVREDVPHLKEVLDSIDLFPSAILDDLIAGYLEGDESGEVWFTALMDGRPVAVGYCAPEKLTEGTHNLYAIGVRSDLQGQGVGQQMMRFIENHLVTAGSRILIVETSGTADFAPVRSFYEGLGYSKEAVIRDFWSDGDDKVVFWKRLGSS